jgi:chromate transporter
MNATSPFQSSLLKIFFAFLRLGMTAFGGPAMVAHIKELSVKKNSWLDENRFKEGMVLCQTLPGATAMQMAGYVGLQIKGIRGALAAYLGFGFPAFILMLLFSFLYKNYYQLSFVHALFAGLQVVVVAVVAQAAYSFATNIARDRQDLWRNGLIAFLSAGFLGFGVSPFPVILGAGLISLVLFPRMKAKELTSISLRGPLKNITILCLILLAGMGLLYVANPVFFSLSTLMMKIDFFAFGGGFTSVPLMLHEIVEVNRWMGAKIFMDGIALGQVTPGPIVITATFVGYWLYGWTGALIATVSIFTPSFLLLIVINPLFDRLRSSLLFLKATKGILASFVGLLFYVMVKFALAVPWDVLRILMGTAVLVALIKKMDLLYVVIIGGTVSIWLFS